MTPENRLLRKAIMSAHDWLNSDPTTHGGIWADASLNAYCEVGSQLYHIAATTHTLRTIVMDAVRVAGPLPDIKNRVSWLDDLVADVQNRVKDKKKATNKEDL